MDTPASLESVLNELGQAGRDHAQVSVAEVRRRLGRRTFGPLLVVPGIIAFTPLGGIPGLPTILAVTVIVIASQVLFGSEAIWLPSAIRRRSVSGGRLEKSARIATPVARCIDWFLRPRLTVLVSGVMVRVIAGLCVLLALTVPPLELVPFGGTPTWLAITALGLALLAHDGILAIASLVFSVGSLYLLVQYAV